MNVLTTKYFKLLTGALSLFAVLGMSAAQAGGSPKSGGFAMSANIAVNSQYIFRGITNSPEDGNAALQGGFDWSKGDTGLYFGYWGSSLGYSKPTTNTGDGFENDLYAGYKGKIGGIGYDVGFLTYVYANVDDADTTEFNLSFSTGAFTAGIKLNIGNDVDWSNEGDLYYFVSAETKLPKGFTVSAIAGFYDYDTGPLTTTNSGGFRHLDITLSHAIGKTGADMNVTAIFGGDDRNGVDQDDAIVFGISYNFDI